MESRDWENHIERAIKNAMDEGKFDNLPGKGKPFTHLDSDPLAQVVEAQGFAPRWVELDREIRQRLEAAEQATKRTFAWAAQTWKSGGAADRQFAEQEWLEAQRVLGNQLDEINQLVKLLNLELPPAVRHLQRVPLKVQDQLGRLGLPQRLMDSKPD